MRKSRMSIRRIPPTPSIEILEALRVALFLDDPLSEEEMEVALEYDAKETGHYFDLIEQVGKGQERKV